MPLKSLNREHRTPVLIAIVVGLVLRIVFIFATPFNEPERVGELSAYNDEPAHVSYTRHIVHTGTLPREISPITSKSNGDLPTFENYQSPLSYILHAIACKPFNVRDSESIAAIGRWLSLLYMVLAFTLAVSILNELGRLASSASRAVFLIFIALSGVFVRFSTLAGNEMLAWLMIGWIVLAYLNHERYASSRNFYWLIIAFILGVYVKLTVLLTVPLLALAIVKAYRSEHSRAVIGLIYVLSACIPLAAYNYFMFGSALPLSTGFGAAEWRLPDLSTLIYAARSSVFPWSELWRNWLGLALLAPALLGIGWICINVLKSFRSSLWAYTIFATSIAAFVWLNMRYNQAEGRYLFAAWPALIIGIEALPVKLRSPWLWIVTLLLPYLLFVL